MNSRLSVANLELKPVNLIRFIFFHLHMIMYLPGVTTYDVYLKCMDASHYSAGGIIDENAEERESTEDPLRSRNKEGRSFVSCHGLFPAKRSRLRSGLRYTLDEAWK